MYIPCSNDSPFAINSSQKTPYCDELAPADGYFHREGRFAHLAQGVTIDDGVIVLICV